MSEESNLAKRTLKGRVLTLKVALDYAVKKSIINFSPIKIWPKVELEKNKNELPRYLTEEELFLLEKTAKKMNIRTYNVIYTLARTGLRISELCALKESNIDLEKNYIYLAPNMTKGGYATFNRGS